MGKKKSQEYNQCPVSWNENSQPHKAECTNTKGHRGKHRDRRGRTLNNGDDKERGGE